MHYCAEPLYAPKRCPQRAVHGLRVRAERQADEHAVEWLALTRLVPEERKRRELVRELLG
eukprot:4784703-Pleurochrysis_carterae.AAC.1